MSTHSFIVVVLVIRTVDEASAPFLPIQDGTLQPNPQAEAKVPLAATIIEIRVDRE